MAFSFDRSRIDKLSKEFILEELRRVGAKLGARYFTGREFNQHSPECKHSTVLRNFGSWAEALRAAGIDSSPRRKQRADAIPVPALFGELERIWRQLGHRPSKIEWEGAAAKYSYKTYRERFGGWTNACAQFIEFKSEPPHAPTSKRDAKDSSGNKQQENALTEAEKRSIPLKLRLEVLKRDQFRCILCGRSPAIESGVTLHVDHRIPFSKGGTTELGNLQTLCQDCNWGNGSTF
jgi:hypothetical protein